MPEEIKVGTAAEVLAANALGRTVVHTPPPTGQLKDAFAGSVFNASLDKREPEVAIAQVVPRDVKSFEVERVPDKGTELSGTQAFLSKGK